MKKELKKTLLNIIDNVLTLKGWDKISEPILFDKSTSNTSKYINNYFEDMIIFREAKKNKELSLLIETIGDYEKAIEDDWFPDEIVNLTVPKAYLFLKEIRRIICTITDKSIEQELIDTNNKIENSK